MTDEETRNILSETYWIPTDMKKAKSEFPVGLAASMIKRSLDETQVMIINNMLEEAGMLEDFKTFCTTNKMMDIFQASKEFAKLHPDKFYVRKEEEIKWYGKMFYLNGPIICKSCEKEPIECDCA